MMGGRLKDRTILVTGASSGIGWAIAMMAAGEGARIVAQGRNRERLEKLISELPGSAHIAVERELDQLDGLEAWLEHIVADVGPLSGFVHSAGVAFTEPLKVVRAEGLERMFRLNVLCAILIAKALRKPKNHAPNASIVLLSSVAAAKGSVGLVAYSGTKGALQSMSRSLALELIKDGVRVNCVAPAMVDTEMARAFQQKAPDAWDAEMAEHPMGLGQPDDVARMVCYLLSDDARWITGAHIPVDGGYTA